MGLPKYLLIFFAKTTLDCEDKRFGQEGIVSKFIKDKSAFSRPSVSSFMIINLDQTDITESIVDTIVTTISESDKVFRKIAFVGVNARWHQPLSKIKKRGIAVRFLDDYEKAKEWLYA